MIPKHLTAPRAEEALLGSILIDNDVLAWVDVTPRSFFDPRNRVVFAAMQALAADGMAIDEVTIAMALTRAGKLEAIGGEPRISHLALGSFLTSSAASYATQLERARVGRDLLVLCDETKGRLNEGEPLEVLTDLVRDASAIDRAKDTTTFVLGEVIANECKQVFSDLENDKDPSGMIKTGLERFDETIGGLPVGVPTLIGAPPATGKSALTLKLALFQDAHGDGAAIFTYEDRVTTWAQRTLAQASGVSASDIRRRRLGRTTLGHVGEAAEQMRATRNVIIEHAHGRKTQQMIRRARALRRQYGMRFFAIDFMQLIPNPDPMQFRKRDQAVAENLRLWADFAGEENVCVVMLWQLTRDFEKRGTAPVRTDFADSAGAERYGKLILALWEPANAGGDLEMVVVKNNNGGVATFDLAFDRPLMRIG